MSREGRRIILRLVQGSKLQCCLPIDISIIRTSVSAISYVSALSLKIPQNYSRRASVQQGLLDRRETSRRGILLSKLLFVLREGDTNGLGYFLASHMIAALGRKVVA